MINVIKSGIPIIILIIIFLGIYRLVYNLNNNKEFHLKDIIYLSFIIYIFILIYLVTYRGLLDYNPDINLRLFKEIFRYKIGSYLFLQNIVGNILLFIPFGSYFKYEFKLKLIYTLIITIIFSISIELVQLLIGRIFDIDDILLNIIGSIIGYFIVKILYKWCKNTIYKLKIKKIIIYVLSKQ